MAMEVEARWIVRRKSLFTSLLIRSTDPKMEEQRVQERSNAQLAPTRRTSNVMGSGKRVVKGNRDGESGRKRGGKGWVVGRVGSIDTLEKKEDDVEYSRDDTTSATEHIEMPRIDAETEVISFERIK
uniref:Uncharacterized protein n=1 Tax=Vespula pensylvanica TaxID=30213 RepID=A0A834UCI8_VESPE|nr:hypothetical protein H0235_006400 [Vespula pensylvanica]